MNERKARITVKAGLSVIRQCQLLAVPRSSVYARHRDVAKADLELMRQIDELYLKWPFYGSRRMSEELRQRGYVFNRKRVQRLMRQMGLRAVYPKPRTSQPGAGHKTTPISSPASPLIGPIRCGRVTSAMCRWPRDSCI